MKTTIFVMNYNYGRFVAEAIESALAQDDPEGTQVIVIDDGSTDDSGIVYERFEGAMQVLRKPNTGLSDSRNYAAARCTTPYLLFLDADNRLPPEFVRVARTALESSGAEFAYTQLRYFGESERLSAFGRFDPERLKRGNYIDAGALLRTQLFESFQYDIHLRHGLEDWDFYLTLIEHGLNGVLVSGTWLWFRTHGANMGVGVQKRGWRRRETYLRIMFKHRRIYNAGDVAGFGTRMVRHQVRRLRVRLVARKSPLL